MRIDSNRLGLAVKDAWKSITVNAVPMTVLWILAASAAAAYLGFPGFRRLFAPVVELQLNGGALAAFLNRVIFLGLLPGVFLLSVREIRPKYPWRTIVAYSLWGGLWGFVDHWFFTLQEAVFGAGSDLWTLALKTLTRQLVLTVILGIIPSAVFYMWLARDFSWSRLRTEWPPDFLAGVCLPMLIANFMIWTPVNVSVYYFPLPLQIQLFGFAGAFWMLAALAVGRQEERRRRRGGSAVVKTAGALALMAGMLLVPHPSLAAGGEGASDAVTVRTKAEPRYWQAVTVSPTPLRWAWAAGAETAELIVSNRVSAAVSSVEVARNGAEADGEYVLDSPDAAGRTAEGETVLDLRLVQRGGGMVVGELAASLACIGGTGGSPVTVRSRSRRDWEKYHEARVGLAEEGGFSVYSASAAGLMLMLR